MPTIVHIKCQACGHSPEVKSNLPGPDYSQGKSNEVTGLATNRLALEMDDRTIVRLSHPGEGTQLERLGYTWNKAISSGRLLNITFKLCTTCGTIHEESQIATNSRGCLYTPIVGIGVLLLFKLILRTSWIIAIVSGYVGTALCLQLMHYYRSRPWRRKNAELKISNCLACNGKAFIDIGAATKKLQVCPHCHTQNMQYKLVGIS